MGGFSYFQGLDSEIAKVFWKLVIGVCVCVCLSAVPAAGVCFQNQGTNSFNGIPGTAGGVVPKAVH